MRVIRPRLALRIYLAGLAQIAAVVLGFMVLLRVRAAADAAREREARAAVESVAARLGDEAAVRAELDRIARDLDASITLHDDRGRVLATNRREGDPPPPPPRRGPFDHRPPPPEPPLNGPPPNGPPPHDPPPLGAPPGPPPPDFPPRPGMTPALVTPVILPDGTRGIAIFARRSPPSFTRDAAAIVALVLVAVGVVSLLLARSLSRPLGRLSRAARAFGAGRLEARAELTRSDEIGDVAAAFDEMAERITSLLAAEKELLANVSHELRTPLARIRVALDIAEEGDAEIARASLRDIAEDLGELERLISDVLTAARLDLGAGPGSGGIPPLRRELLSLGELLDRAASRFSSAHPGRPLAIAIAPDLPEIDGDPVLLRRVVDNLLENAHKYSPRPEDGIGLAAAASDTEVRIEVRDHGIGIAAADLPHVFRPFFRADRSRARATGGLGLGHALARRIVEAHAGTITLESALGEGTRAVVRLPRALS